MARLSATPELIRIRFTVVAGSFAAGDGAGDGDVAGAADGAGEANLCWNRYPRRPASIRATAIVPAIFMAQNHTPNLQSRLNYFLLLFVRTTNSTDPSLLCMSGKVVLFRSQRSFLFQSLCWQAPAGQCHQCKSLIFVLVLFWHIVFRELSGLYFALVGIGSILHAANGFSFRILALFDQLFHAFRIVIALA